MDDRTSFWLDRESRVPLYVQLATSIRAAVKDGRLARGAALPSTRALATRLKVSRNTVIQAYEELAAEGVVDSRRGSATRILGGRRRAPAVVHWRLFLKDAGCPERSVPCGDPDGTALYVFSAGKR